MRKRDKKKLMEEGLSERERQRIERRQQGKTKIKLGRTIVAEREKIEPEESERQKLRVKMRVRKGITVGIAVVMAGILLVLAIIGWREWLGGKDSEVQEVISYEPTIEVMDETMSGKITSRMKEYIGKMERDLKDLGYTAVRAVLPEGKTREVDLYVNERGEYYKLSIDRGTAETAEDIVRMIKYLDERGIKPTYVDVRLEERAYYK